MIKLPFDYETIGTLNVAPDWCYITIYRPDHGTYVTYQYNADTGDAYWGHYDITSRRDALADMINRAGGPLNV
jgi:hypothetical protein